MITGVSVAYHASQFFLCSLVIASETSVMCGKHWIMKIYGLLLTISSHRYFKPRYRSGSCIGTLVFTSEKYYAIKLHSQLRRLCRIASIKSYCDWALFFWYHVITELRPSIPRINYNSTLKPIWLPVVPLVATPARRSCEFELKPRENTIELNDVGRGHT